MASNNSDPVRKPARRLGEQLKRLRLDAGYSTQAALSKRIGFGEDVISKYESGAQSPSDQVFPLVIEACRTSADGMRQVLTDREIAALTAFWETVRERDSAVPESTRPWYKAEGVAQFIRAWDASLVPGLLQAKEYARPLFEALGLEQDKVEELLSVLARRQSMLGGPDSVQFVAVLHQSVLYQLIGSPEGMTRQMTHLLAMSEYPNVTIQIVRGPGAYPALSGGFQIASTHGEPDLVLVPTVEDLTSDSPELASKAGILFERVRRHALTVEDSRGVIREAHHHWESQQK
jgi:transcriptional regulator with XRE-family HTH domain